MTALEMQLKFTQSIQNHLDKDFDIKTIDIEYFLNLAQWDLTDSYYRQYENDEKSRKVLANLVYNVDLTRTSVSASQVGIHPNGEYWDLPTNILFVLKEEATLNINSCGDTTSIPANYQRVTVKPINMDYYNKHITNAFKKPYEKLVWRMDVTNGNNHQHELITAGQQIYKYHLTYLKEPVDISVRSSVNCELMDWVHQDIVDNAVLLALKAQATNKQFKTN